jgi:predicted nuclease with TOPRIM domain
MLEERIESFKARLQTCANHRQELTTEEALLPQQLSEEEGQLSAVSERLEQLEGSLTPPNH